MKQLVPAEALVIVWCIGVAFGYFLAWMRFKRAYLMVDKERLKRNQAQVAVQNPVQNARCACCKETERNEANTGFKCGCGWSAEDLITNRWDDNTCTKHRKAS